MEATPADKLLSLLALLILLSLLTMFALLSLLTSSWFGLRLTLLGCNGPEEVTSTIVYSSES